MLSIICAISERKRGLRNELIFFSLIADPILLFTKSRGRACSYGQGRDEIPRAGVVLACGDTVQRQRQLEAVQGSKSRRGFMRPSIPPRPHRRASRTWPLPSRRLWRPPKRRRGTAVAHPSQRA